MSSTTTNPSEYQELLLRQEQIKERLHEIGVPPVSPPKKRKGAAKLLLRSEEVPLVEKTDTHWDYLMKEMQWLAADFQAERKRHFSGSRKLSNGVKQYHKSQATRHVRELAEAELKRRRLAAKCGREVKAFWTKIERVITYKQKLNADEQRRHAMNKQLVALVKQTERYSESLARQEYEDSEDDNSDLDGRHRRRRRRLTIEEALAAGLESRRSKTRVTDYARIQQLTPKDESLLYGESTASDSGSDASYTPEHDLDDETTLLEAEAQETLERKRRGDLSDDDERSYVADPEELRKLQEESEMDISTVLERLQNEGKASGDFEPMDVDKPVRRTRRVKFADTVDVKESPAAASTKPPAVPKPDPGEDADDDADASDVEDFVEMETESLDGSEDFVADEDEIDDETTMIEEEKLPREMSADEEIRMLEEEGNLSIEELRKRYAVAFATNNAADEEQETEQPVARRSALSEMLEEDDASEEEEFRPVAGTDIDDETTIAAEERLGRDITYEEEIAMLQNESEIPVEQLRAMYASIDELEPDEDEADSVPEEDESDRGVGASLASLFASGENDEGDRDEFRPDAEAVDDETTIEAEEKLGRDMSYEDEIAMLKRESEMSVEDLRAMYAGIEEAPKGDEERPVRQSELSALSETLEDQENDGDFEPDDEEKDDETTIEAEERLGREMSAEDEIAMLKRESEMPVEALREMYQQMDQFFSGESESDGSSSKRKRASGESGPAGSERKRPRRHSDEDASDSGRAALDALEASAERARTTLASRPYLLCSWVKLREYQQVGLNWLVSLQSRRLNGILADEMGLGKTLQTISLLAYLAAYKGIWGPHLVVVPTSVIVNWETELKRFCPALKVLCYYGSAKRRKELRTGWTKTNWYHVVVTSYQLAVQDAFAFKRKRWYYLVLDEAQNIKNFQSQRWQTLINFNTQRRLLLTGTPLQNNLMELWSLLHFLMPYIFRSRKEFSYWFANPMTSMIEGTTDQNDEVVNRLHGIIRPFVLRRLKKDVETQMPGKYEHIIKCQLSRRQMFIYEEFMARSSTRQALKQGGNFMGMMNVLMQLRKVCNHPDLFESRSIITPFVLDPISLRMPSCVIGAHRTYSVFDTVSPGLRVPLWSGSQGEPSLDACLRHDEIECCQLRRLEASRFAAPQTSSDALHTDDGHVPALTSLLKDLSMIDQRGKSEHAEFMNALNQWRCQCDPFAYPSHLVDAVTVSVNPIYRNHNDILSTPAQLLEMRRTQQERAEDVDDLIKKFVFCVPKAGVRRPSLETMSADQSSIPENVLNEMLLEPMEVSMRPFRKAQARLSSFFPDKKLVQFDAGKLQTLAELLRELKKGGHRALIFTQMSKMLDILEAFLNLNGHTYLRLDGATGVDRRQRLMDRFNNDPKIFCFILSTRSGGLGINLTGADTVIFYDSDWNPAMDSRKEAQDRAHRIGQTRDVHIFRLVTEHTIEENILAKAQQKRNLDILVMDKGKFDASQLFAQGQKAKASSSPDENRDVYTKGGLRAILGVITEAEAPNDSEDREDGETDVPKDRDQMEAAMTSLEDAEDVQALRGAEKEAEEELKEFDESDELKKGSGAEDDDEADQKKRKDESVEDKEEESEDQKKEEEELQKEFAALQSKVGMDASAIEGSLSPTERYALRFREEIDPYYSLFAVMEYRRRMEAAEEEENEIDIDEIEREKAMEERRAMDEGDLLATRPSPEDLIRQRNLYQREKSRLRANKKRRKLTGENWEARVDGTSQLPFWYNIDTGEATWHKPGTLLDLEAYELAIDKRWAAMPLNPLVHVMSFVPHSPDRIRSSMVCRQWQKAANDASFVRHVYPVEMGALTREDRKMEYNHYRSISEALLHTLPGETIELGDGHYWLNEDLVVDFPLRLIGDEHNPSNVVVEMSGTIKWRGKGGWCEGVTFRRPKLSSTESSPGELLRIEGEGRLDMFQSVFDNEGSKDSVVTVTGSGRKGHWESVLVKGGADGFALDEEATLELVNVPGSTRRVKKLPAKND